MMVAIETQHVSVLLREVIESLVCREDRLKNEALLILDCTLGGGGHARAMLDANSNAVVVGLDKDANAIQRTKMLSECYPKRFFSFQADFRDLQGILRSVAVTLKDLVPQEPLRFDGVIADLGISSDQLDDPSRGLSFSLNGPLDMRLDLSSELTADRVVNEYGDRELAQVFRRGGVGADSIRLARAIVQNRPVRDTWHLRDVCESVMRRPGKRSAVGSKKSHPATVPFQAIRMEVNSEIDAVEGLMSDALEILAPKGRLAVISFHSLEDKVVAHEMRQWARSEFGPRGLACGGTKAKGRLLTKQAVTPKQDEIESNPRARSARMRVFERGVEE